MKNPLLNISLLSVSMLFMLVSFKKAGSKIISGQVISSPVYYYNPIHDSLPAAAATDADEALIIYDSMQLEKAGLSKEAFEYAWKGYKVLARKKLIGRTDILTICDFSQSSRNKRMYVVDTKNFRLLLQTHVAHGKNSGAEYATRFSNKAESLQSSLGFYVTRSTYFGGHGLSLKIDGLEPGINDKAQRRNIVVHGSDYVGGDYLRFSQHIGRSFGCPAVPARQSKKIINIIKNGTCFFIYHPTTKYITASKIINGLLDTGS